MGVFTQGRSIYSDNIGQSLVFPVTAFTSGLNYLPELTYVFGFSKRIFLLVCSVIIILAAVISCVIYKTYFSLIYGIYDQGLKETRAITENQLLLLSVVVFILMMQTYVSCMTYFMQQYTIV